MRVSIKRWVLLVGGLHRWQAMMLVAIGLMTVACMGVLVTYGLWRAEPAVWRDAQMRLSRIDPEQLALDATDLEQRVVRLVGSINGQQTLLISADDANAWLRTRLRDWLLNRQTDGKRPWLPQSVEAPIVSIDGRRVIVALRCASDELTQVFSAEFDVEPQPDGSVIVRLLTVRGGQLPLPIGTALKQAGLASAPWAESFRDAIDQLRRGVTIGPSIPIGDPNGDRQVTLLNVVGGDGHLTITARTDIRYNPE